MRRHADGRGLAVSFGLGKWGSAYRTGVGRGAGFFIRGHPVFSLRGLPPLNSFRIAAIFRKYAGPRLAVFLPPICPARLTIRLSETGLPQWGHLITPAA